MPGLAAVKAGKDEFSVLNVLSGVTARLCGFGAERFVFGGGDTGGVDQAKVGAGGALFDPVRLVDGPDGRTVDDVADMFAQVSPPSISVPPADPC
jgi:hypothetical protein